MPDLVTIVILGLAAYRAARLIATDSLTQDARAALYRWAWLDPPDGERAWSCFDKDGNDAPCPRGRVRPYVYELITCPFCIGVWMSGAAFVVWALWLGCFPNLAVSLLVVLAVAGVQSLAQALDASMTTVAD